MRDEGSSNPDVTVVVPVWNTGHRLRDCLESIAAQSFTAWEAICVDDGSTDRSPEVLSEFASADSRFRVLRTPRRSGAGMARNLALDAASGRFVLFVDSDDRLPRDAMERLVALADRSGSEVVRGSLVIVTSRGPQTNMSWQTATDRMCAAFADVPESHIPWGFTSYLFARGLIERHGIRFDASAAEDPPFLTRCLLAANHLSTTSHPVYFYDRDRPRARRSRRQLEDFVAHVGRVHGLLRASGHEREWGASVGPFYSGRLRSAIRDGEGVVGRLRLAREARRVLTGDIHPTPSWAAWPPLIRAALLGRWWERVVVGGADVRRRIRHAPSHLYRRLPVRLRAWYLRLRGRAAATIDP